jgi:NTE family protein
MDGGVANNFPIAHAVAAGATTVYVLPTGYACALPAPPRGALAMAMHAVSLLLEQRLAADAARVEHTIDLRVLPPLCPLRVTPVDFGHTDELIDPAYRSSANWLSTARAESGITALDLHEHGRPALITGASAQRHPIQKARSA